jgi:hypothetical protein
MALQNKLKAFVRFDGSGRVIPSSLILQKSKPKVGNWKEINAKECCNYTPGTTTTTTTTSGVVNMPFVLFGLNTSPCIEPTGSINITYPPGITTFCAANTIFGNFSAFDPDDQIVGTVGGRTTQWRIIDSTSANRASNCGFC